MEQLLMLGLRWLHILSSIVMVGGVFYLRFVVVPTVEALPPEQRESIGAALRGRWAKWVMISIALLLFSGLVNMILVPLWHEFPPRAMYGMWTGIKFLLALPVFFLVSTLAGRSKNAEKFREKSRLWLNIALAISVLVVVLGGYIRFIPRTPKTGAGPAEAAAVFHPSSQSAPPAPATG